MHPYDAQSTIRRDWKSEAATPSRARPRAILLRAGLPVAGVAALWLLGSGAAAYAALVVVFALLLWALDRLVPATGSARADAERAFESAQRKRRRAARRRFRRASGDTGLQLLPAEIQQGASQRARGIQAIRLDSIVGTVEPDRAAAFDPAFRPPEWSWGRWQLMWMASEARRFLPSRSTKWMRRTTSATATTASRSHSPEEPWRSTPMSPSCC
jgi:hypothetical protein